MTALLQIDLTRGALARGQLRGRIEVYPAFEPSTVEIGGQPVPLEADTSAAFAFSLSDPKIWSSEFAGFLRGDYFANSASQLSGLEPIVRASFRSYLSTARRPAPDVGPISSMTYKVIP